MISLEPSSVAVDATAIRRIREEKKLTQLYVAKVVGVTTDTVSRWENNRYPSIKRENALRLAEALEVSVEQIIERTGEEEQGPETGAEVLSEKQRPGLGPVFIGSIAILALLVAVVTFYAVSRKNGIPLDQFAGGRQLP